MSHTKDPFEELEAMDEEKAERKKRTVAKYYVVQELAFVCNTPAQVNDYFRDNYKEGMSVIKGFQSAPRRKESFEF